MISVCIFPSSGLPQVSFALDEAAQERQFLILQWYQPPPTFAEKNFSTSVVRMHETRRTSRSKENSRFQNSFKCDVITSDAYVTAIARPLLPLDRRSPPGRPSGRKIIGDDKS